MSDLCPVYAPFFGAMVCSISAATEFSAKVICCRDLLRVAQVQLYSHVSLFFSAFELRVEKALDRYWCQVCSSRCSLCTGVSFAQVTVPPSLALVYLRCLFFGLT
jgi:hypothetical protein